jgi:hypothetical protein
MPTTAATYLSKYNTAQSTAITKAGQTVAFGGGPDVSLAWSAMAATWGFLYIERSRLTACGFTPSAAAEAYATEAEAKLASAQTKIPSEIPVSLAYTQIASNAAFMFAEQTRVEHTTVGEL